MSAVSKGTSACWFSLPEERVRDEPASQEGMWITSAIENYCVPA